MLRCTYHVEGKTAAELIKGLQAHIALLQGGNLTLAGTPAKKRGRPAKAAEAEETESADGIELEDEESDDTESEEDTESEDETDEESEDTESEDEEETDSEDEEESEDTEPSEEEEKEKSAKKTAPKVSLDQLLAGFQKHVKKHGRDSGMKILKKFKVASVRALKEKQFPEAMALLQKK